MSDSSIKVRFCSDTNKPIEVLDKIFRQNSGVTIVGDPIYVNSKLIRRSANNTVEYRFDNEIDEDIEKLFSQLTNFLKNHHNKIAEISSNGWKVTVVFAIFNDESSHIGYSLSAELIELLHLSKAELSVDCYVVGNDKIIKN